jgi:hypothetical protein
LIIVFDWLDTENKSLGKVALETDDITAIEERVDGPNVISLRGGLSYHVKETIEQIALKEKQARAVAVNIGRR